MMTKKGVPLAFYEVPRECPSFGVLANLTKVGNGCADLRTPIEAKSISEQYLSSSVQGELYALRPEVAFFLRPCVIYQLRWGPDIASDKLLVPTAKDHYLVSVGAIRLPPRAIVEAALEPIGVPIVADKTRDVRVVHP